MELEQSAVKPPDADGIQAYSPEAERRGPELILPQQDTQSCATCGNPVRMSSGETMTPGFIYAIGRIEHRFPSLGVEKEFMQVSGRAEPDRLSNRQAVHNVLTKPENRYLVRQLCWVMTIAGLETYILVPRNPEDLNLLVDSLRRYPDPQDVDVVVGVRGPIARPEMCNGLMIPMVMFDQIYSFDRESFITSIPLLKDVPEDEFRDNSREVLDTIMLVDDNAGATDEHRALNYLAVRYPMIYQKATEKFRDNSVLTAVEARPSRLSSTRKIVDVIVSFTNRQTDVTDKFFVRVDVTEEFPFLVSKLASYYER